MEHSVSQEKVGSVIAWAARIMVLVAILAFFLPYASCSVGKEKVGFSSAELAAGKDKEVSVSFLGRSESKAISLEPHPALFLFLALPLLAGGLSFFKKQIARGIAYFLEGVIFLLYNNYVLRTLRSQLSYGEFDLSRYTLNLEIGYKLYQVHGSCLGQRPWPAGICSGQSMVSPLVPGPVPKRRRRAPKSLSLINRRRQDRRPIPLLNGKACPRRQSP